MSSSFPTSPAPGENPLIAPPLPSLASECRETIALALPLMAGQLGQMLMGVIDTLMVAKLGVVPLGASAFVNTLLSVPYILGIGLLASISVRSAQARGAGGPAEARNILRHGTWLALGYGLLVFGSGWWATSHLALFGQPPEVAAASPRFLFIISISMVPALLSMAWKSHGDALDHPWPPFWILLGGVVLNTLLNWLLIEGHAGFPALGLEGASVATLIARVLVAVALLLWLMRAKTVRDWCPDWKGGGWWERCRMEGFKNLLAIGIPASLQLLSEVTAFAATGLLIGTLGSVPLAAHQVAITCAATTFMVPLGVAMAMTVRIGNVVGADAHRRGRRVLLSGWLFSLGFMFFSMLGFLTGGPWIASLFVTEPEVIKIAAGLLAVAGFFQLFDGLQVVSSGALRGINDARVPAWLTLLAYWGIALPLGAWLCLGWHLGARGMWTGLAAGLVVAGVSLGLRAWRKL